MEKMDLHSPAKLNLVLDLIRKREDGYHETDFVMQELELCDSIEIRETEKEIKITSNKSYIPTGKNNTCYQAVELVKEFAEKKNIPTKGIHIHLEKNIPIAGGLGGGSSNAATVIKGLNKIWNLNLSKEEMMTIASKIGSDVSFFIEGGTCRATGRGEIIAPIEKCPTLHLAFISPPIKTPKNKTAWIYSHFNVQNVSIHPSVDEIRKAIQSNDAKKVAEKMGNVFEALSLKEYVPVFHLIESLKTLPGVWNAILAGAGPTVCAICENEKTAHQIIAPFEAKGWETIVTKTK